MPSHRLIHSDLAKRLAAAPKAPQWPSFNGISTFAGITSSGKVMVWYDASLGAQCKMNALDLLAAADGVVAANDAIFGTTGGPVSVIVFALGGATDGTGGADHMGCDYQTGQNIEVCASFGQSDRVIALFEAELSEDGMGHNLCGQSTGEALSRWAAMQVSNNALSDFATGPTWDQDGRPNFVDSVDPTDQNPDSTGCGMVFISWLMSIPPHPTLATIAQAMVKLGDGGTLAQLYSQMTGDLMANAWSKFIIAVNALANGIQSDDPFGATQPQPQPGPTPPPPPPPGPTPPPTPPPTPGPGVSGLMWAILASNALLAGVDAGETASEIKSDVDSIPT